MADGYLLSVVHVFLIQDERILLLRRRNTGRHDGEYGLPAGRLERGEEVHSAAIRETEEECGVIISRDNLRMVCVMQVRTAESERVDFFFTAKDWAGEPRNMEPEKCDDLRWFPLDRLPDNLILHDRLALDKHRQGEWFFSLGWE
ncbi:NUDIX domain-containing protein [Paenibacillus tepidiphilus]|uniref:NUDIX domain-containing protein n=1 Tax=Paenibacillus tepidiphilus TaxID=2608683 RepID=UPI00123B921B